MNYEAWRATFQSSEQAAKAAFEDARKHHEMLLNTLTRCNELDAESHRIIAGLQARLKSAFKLNLELAGRVERQRCAMAEASNKHIDFAKRIAQNSDSTAMQAVDKAASLLVRESYHVSVNTSCLAQRDAEKQAEAVNEFAKEVWEEIFKHYRNIKVYPLTMAKAWCDRRSKEAIGIKPATMPSQTTPVTRTLPGGDHA